MGIEIVSVLGALGVGSVFALVAVLLAGWMAWRIVDKAGLPGWLGFGAILLTLTAVGTVVPLILLWIFAFMRWPRDEPLVTYRLAPDEPPEKALPGAAAARLPAPPMALADRRGWRLIGRVAGASLSLAFDGRAPAYLLTGAPAQQPTDLPVPDPSVGQPHARLHCAEGRLGLEDLGAPGGTFIDGARLLPVHGPRDITQARKLKFGNVELALSRA